MLGALPLAIGMKVALTEHVDRSEEKNLLRGCTGYVHSWIWHANEPRPEVVYLKFADATWQLDGIEEPGIYPILPKTKTWFLDKGRKVSVLGIKRTQLPLAPGYAMTAHSSQGKTLPAVLLDLDVDKQVDPTFGTVAATRVRSREDVLILRGFRESLFQRGAADGPELLLNKLRGDRIDWAVYRASRRPSTTCWKCKEIKTLDFFSHEQWELYRVNKASMCMACKEDNATAKRRKLEGMVRLECLGCMVAKVDAAFPRAQINQQDAESKRRCMECLRQERDAMVCCRCGMRQDRPVYRGDVTDSCYIERIVI